MSDEVRAIPIFGLPEVVSGANIGRLIADQCLINNTLPCDGDLIVGNDADGNGGEKFFAPTYACRPPGVYHGPFKSDEGCVMFELHYYYQPDPD